MSAKLDRWINEHVMGLLPYTERRGEFTHVVWVNPGEEPWRRVRGNGGEERYARIEAKDISDHNHIEHTPGKWSTSISDSWRVVEKMRERGYTVTIVDDACVFSRGDKMFTGNVQDIRESICLAAKAALEDEDA